MPTDDPFASAEAHYAEHRPRYGDRPLDYLVDRFGLGGASRALDLGCGAGQIAVPLATRAGGVVGMDPNEAMLDGAREAARRAGRPLRTGRRGAGDIGAETGMSGHPAASGGGATPRPSTRL